MYMKKLILFILLLLMFFIGQTQERHHTFIAQRYEWLAGIFQALNLPAGNGPAAFKPGQRTSAGAVYYDSSGIDAGLYIYDGTTWVLVSGGGGSVEFASQGLSKDGDTLQLGNVFGDNSARFIWNRNLELNRKILSITNQYAADSLDERFSYFQAILVDTIKGETDDYDVVPKSGVNFKRRFIYDTGHKIRNRFGNRLAFEYVAQDSISLSSDGGDFGYATINNLLISSRPGYTGRTIVRGGHVTTYNVPYETIGATLSKVHFNQTTDGGTDNLRMIHRGYLTAHMSYFSTGNFGKLDTVDKVIMYNVGTNLGTTVWVNKFYVLRASQITNTRIDSTYFLYDSLPNTRSFHRGNLVVGSGAWSSPYTFRNNGTTLLQDSLNAVKTLSYSSNIAANYWARSLVDKNYVDSSIAAIGGSVPSLQDVIDVGSSTNQSIFFTGSAFSIYESSGGITFDHGGGNASYFQSGTLAGKYRWYPIGGLPYFEMDGSAITVTRNIVWRDLAGTVALLSDITGGAAITTLNTLTDATQTFAEGTTGADFNIASAAGVHTFNIPDAGAAARGLVNTGSQSFAGAKTFTGFTGLTGGFATNGVAGNSNMYVTAGLTANRTTTAAYLPESAAGLGLRVGINGSTAYTMTAGDAYSTLAVAGTLVTEAATSSHPLISALSLIAPTVTNGAGATTNMATLYINAAPSGVTPSGGSYAQWIKSGKLKLDGGITFDNTVTAGGTTGNQTINKASGTVNVAAAGTTVTVTNSFCTSTSIVFAVLRTNDSTAAIKNVVPGAGSFVITLTAAATAEVSIGFLVTN